MANNTTLNPGTGGDVISTEDVSGVKIPRTKIVLGASGVDSGNISTSNPVPTQAQAGENHIGSVGGQKIQVAATFTRPADTTAYAAGDVVSDSTSSTTPMSFANFARVNAGFGYIAGARLSTDKKSITPRVRVHLYNANNPTLSADNAAHRGLYADESKRIGTSDLPAMSTPSDTTNSTISLSYDYTLRIPFVAAASTRTIYSVLETLDAYTPASGEAFSLTLLGEVD